jgi:hypothetical protein
MRPQSLHRKFQTRAKALWEVSQERANTEQAIDDAVARPFKESQTARRRLDVLQDQANGKEALVRALLLDVSVYKNLAERIAKLRKATSQATAPQNLAETIGSFLPPLVKVAGDSEALASQKAQSQIAFLKPVLDKLAAMAKESNNVSLGSYAPIDQQLQRLEERFEKLASANADTAIERFAGMDASIATLRSMMAIVNAAFKSIDDLRLHLSELNRRTDASARDAFLQISRRCAKALQSLKP